LILSSSIENSSTLKLSKSGKKQGHQVQVANPFELGLQMGPVKIFDKKGELKKIDLVLPRLGWLTYTEGLRLTRALEANGTKSVNSSKAIENSHDKLTCHTLLEKSKLPQPMTWFAPRPNADFFQREFPTKCFVKLLMGSQGMGVVWTDSAQHLKAQIDLLRAADTPFLIQEALLGTEVRAFVIQNEVVACMERHPRSGDRRSNLHQGGKAKATKLTEKENQIVLEASKALGLTYAGVDFIRRGKQLWILEVNAFPGLEGIAKISKLNIADLLLKSITS
jgi:ribosomal protein S6--L-glutamate ligase